MSASKTTQSVKNDRPRWCSSPTNLINKMDALLNLISQTE